MSKVGHLQPFYLFLSRLGCSLGELQDVWPDKFCQAKHPEDQNPASICGQDMEFLMSESHMHLQDIKSSPHFLPRTATEEAQRVLGPSSNTAYSGVGSSTPSRFSSSFFPLLPRYRGSVQLAFLGLWRLRFGLLILVHGNWYLAA